MVQILKLIFHSVQIVRDGSIFEGLGLLQVRLRETNDTTLRILDAKFMPVPPTLAYNAENDVNVIGYVKQYIPVPILLKIYA